MRKNKGYTLIELLVVSGILVLVTGFVFTVVISSLRGGIKSRITNEVSKNGNYALSIISTDLINANSVVSVGSNPTCSDFTTTPSTSLSAQEIIVSREGDSNITFACDGTTNITKSYMLPDGSTKTLKLINEELVEVPVCEFKCSQVDLFSPPVVQISFTLKQKSASTSIENTATAPFRTSATLRNFRAF